MKGCPYCGEDCLSWVTDEKPCISPVKVEEVYSGMRLWDSENKRWQKVLRVDLWKKIIKKKPNKFYKNKLK